MMKRRRDKDYRGTRRPVDWSHLVHQVRTKKPGALLVLQDAIEEHFPKQFEAAKREALEAAEEVEERRARYRSHPSVAKKKPVFLVQFHARIASHRYLPWKNPKSHGEKVTPFSIINRKYVSTSQRAFRIEPMNKAYVWSTKGRTETEHRTPSYVGSYRRPKIPVIYWSRNKQGGWAADELVLFVDGRGASKFVEQHQSALGTRWEMDGPNYAYLITDHQKDWRTKLRREGYRNRLVNS